MKTYALLSFSNDTADITETTNIEDFNLEEWLEDKEASWVVHWPVGSGKHATTEICSAVVVELSDDRPRLAEKRERFLDGLDIGTPSLGRGQHRRGKRLQMLSQETSKKARTDSSPQALMEKIRKQKAEQSRRAAAAKTPISSNSARAPTRPQDSMSTPSARTFTSARSSTSTPASTSARSSTSTPASTSARSSTSTPASTSAPASASRDEVDNLRAEVEELKAHIVRLESVTDQLESLKTQLEALVRSANAPSRAANIPQHNESIYTDKITRALVQRCCKMTPSRLVNDLMQGMYEPEYMATHVARYSRAGSSKEAIPAEDRLSIIGAVQHFFPHCDNAVITGYIRVKLSNAVKGEKRIEIQPKAPEATPNQHSEESAEEEFPQRHRASGQRMQYSSDEED